MSRRINHVWRCDICNSCTNPVRAPKCTICGTPAPRTRFGTFSHGRYVLVDLRTGRNAAEARARRVRVVIMVVIGWLMVMPRTADRAAPEGFLSY